MKKYFIIAAAAVVAMAACSKVDAVDNAPAKKISFEVASYVPQTKANGSLANSEDQIFDFHTYAYQFPALGTPVVFMSEIIYAWKSATDHSNTNKAAATADNIVEWAPVDDYFWPKTGTINFYSYAGTLTPDEDTAADAAAAACCRYAHIRLRPVHQGQCQQEARLRAGAYPADLQGVHAGGADPAGG